MVFSIIIDFEIIREISALKKFELCPLKVTKADILSNLIEFPLFLFPILPVISGISEKNEFILVVRNWSNS